MLEHMRHNAVTKHAMCQASLTCSTFLQSHGRLLGENMNGVGGATFDAYLQVFSALADPVEQEVTVISATFSRDTCQTVIPSLLCRQEPSPLVPMSSFLPSYVRMVTKSASRSPWLDVSFMG